MSDAKRPDSDPSMDDILASIRKIISDDEARAQSASPARPSVGSGSLGSSEPPLGHTDRSARPAQGANREDVLLLTDLIEEPRTGSHTVRPTPMPLPRIDPAKAADMPQPTIEPAPGSERSYTDPALIGATGAGAASAAFERLSETVKQNGALPVLADAGPLSGARNKTMEDTVKELLRPMLKEWLDRNLPPMVERLVEREIVRLTRR
jgi:cell pole-organizing protein PopZ